MQQARFQRHTRRSLSRKKDNFKKRRSFTQAELSRKFGLRKASWRSVLLTEELLDILFSRSSRSSRFLGKVKRFANKILSVSSKGPFPERKKKSLKRKARAFLLRKVNKLFPKVKRITAYRKFALVKYRCWLNAASYPHLLTVLDVQKELPTACPVALEEYKRCGC